MNNDLGNSANDNNRWLGGGNVNKVTTKPYLGVLLLKDTTCLSVMSPCFYGSVNMTVGEDILLPQMCAHVKQM